MIRRPKITKQEANSQRQWRNNLPALALTAAVHLSVIAGLFWLNTGPSIKDADAPLLPVQVSFVDSPEPPGPQSEEPEAGNTSDAEPVMPQFAAPAITIVPVAAPVSDTLSAAQLAGAASAGSGGGGGGSCNIAQRVQQALRRDKMVRLAIEGSGRTGQAILMWNGDWVRSGEEEGKGLAVVRQAITWEIAFAPEACRRERVRGLIVMSLADERTRFAVGAGDWRWSDLLGLNNATVSR